MELDSFDEQLKGVGLRSHHQPQDYHKPVVIFINAIRRGDQVHPAPVPAGRRALRRGLAP